MSSSGKAKKVLSAQDKALLKSEREGRKAEKKILKQREKEKAKEQKVAHKQKDRKDLQEALRARVLHITQQARPPRTYAHVCNLMRSLDDMGAAFTEEALRGFVEDNKDIKLNKLVQFFAKLDALSLEAQDVAWRDSVVSIGGEDRIRLMAAEIKQLREDLDALVANTKASRGDDK
eukprot:TRINITY_DN638_c0_g1_i8.p1 TRINITY_DN638_c0_g1~~TRINITY_DN638_c0_g1_i8.p1  ORF type:complete len:197 (-),score=55.32 TRINITY_DN638_c0_g1_i8:631-1158(-)